MSELQTNTDNVNPNVDVGAEPTANVNAGEALNFDDVSEVLESTPAKAVKEPPEGKQKEQEKETKAKAAPKGETPPKAKEGEEPILPGSEQRAGASVETPEPKKIKAWQGDKEIEINHDVEFVQKVAGKPERVKMQDLLDNYSGKVNYDRRFNEVSQKEKKFQEDFNFVNDRIQASLKAAQEGDPDKFISTMASMAGRDPLEVKREYLKSYVDFAEQWAEKGPEERQSMLKDMELETYKKYHESSQAERTQRLEQEKLEKQFLDTKATYQISDKEWSTALETVGRNRVLSDINPNEVVAHHFGSLSTKAIFEAMPDSTAEYERLQGEYDRTGDAFTQDKMNRLFQKLQKIHGDLVDLSAREKLEYRDILDIAREAYGEKPGDKEAAALNRKVKKTQSEGKPTASPKADDSLLTFDDI